MLIWATPVMVERRGLITLSANSFISCDGAVSEVSARKMTGASAGLTLRYAGGVGRSSGSCPIATEMADCAPSAAASRLRLGSNSSVIWELASVLLDVIEVIPAMVANRRSSGAAIEIAMVSGLAPGYCVVTVMVGTSMRGIAAIGSWR